MSAEPPAVITEPSLADVFEVVTRAVFQTGVRWSQIAANWDAYRLAFDGFDVARVAAFGEADIARVLDVPGMLRSHRKIVATVRNAQALQTIVAEYDTFARYLASFPDYAARARDLKKRLAFMGDMNCWYLLFRLHEPVPRFEEWVTTIPGTHPRMREMVERARSQGLSREC